MDFLSNLALGFSVALTPFNLFMAVCGVILGILIGALPGIGPPSGVALLLPLTFGMDPTSGIIMLAALYAGTMYGGTITAVLINTPGESASVVTCLDGHQMALQGRAGPALGIAAIASFIAGTIGVFLLMLVSPLLARWSLAFGPPENFALMLLGLTTVTLLTGESPLKGYISMVFGLMLATVGFDIVSGDARFAFGIPEMMDGIDFLPVAIGLFGIGEVLAGAESASGSRLASGRYGLRDVLPTAADWLRSRWAILRGTVLGFVVGTLPGAGPTVATFMAYAVEKKVSRHTEELGRGAIEGVAAPEAANNAAATGAMVPMLTLGIPGSATTAIMLGGLLMWGLRPGPQLFEKNPQFVWGLIASQYIANVLLLILSTAFIPLFVRALRVPYGILMPIIIVLCITGAFSLKNSSFDVGVMLAFGALGYAMKKLGYSPAALVLALVLGPLAERALRQSLIISDAGIGIFFMRPISAVLTVAALAAILVPTVRGILAASRRRAAAAPT
ncbi:MAG TPA: tripartite tricarboxylate transporter permease [Caldimonas sp.]|jgi:putative tricarboxylic transport membrane protein|nr:tripartite tricarboxylate transporter permease [Caldimonas sp.]HEX2540557.1 tripartite tricarboxylate transporter permease [Caldimonas sp.]